MKKRASFLKQDSSSLAVQPKIAKNKGKKIIENRRVKLCINIISAKGINNKLNHLEVAERTIYLAAAGVSKGEEIFTEPVEGKPYPKWKDENHVIVLSNYNLHRNTFLNVEVMKIETEQKDIPGTSNGFTLVGKARIPLPMELNLLREGHFMLMRAEGKEQNHVGYIELSMVLLPC
ncbi:hypothetical protein PIB30_043516 [Stylosanthes scabra]|uniref:C2 domain-containing protein n=1 Tax=Stylosanthes scabra TaxID=79078 RepID=A0ABU6TF64_9FABA|nr:hypothetical protein [Stylosanthes scabra]